MKFKFFLPLILAFAVTACTSQAGKGRADSEIYLEIAREYLAAGNSEKAIIEADNAINAYPENYKAYFFKSELFAKMERYDEAFKAVEGGAKSLPPEKLFLKDHWMGTINFQKGELKTAEGLFKKSMDAEPKFIGNYDLLGQIYTELGKTDETLQTYQKWAELESDSEKAWDSLGLVYVEVGELDKAQESFDKALSINPDSANVYNNLGSLQQKRNQWEKADGYFQKALELAREHPVANLNHGQYLMLAGKRKEAFPFLKKAVEITPDNIYTQYWIGRYYHEAGEHKEAIGYLAEAIKLDPSFSAARMSLAEAYLDSGSDYGKGMKVMEDGVLLDPPNSKGFYFFLAKLSMAKKDHKSALEYSKKSLEHIATADVKRLASVHLLRGNILDEMGQPAKAKGEYRKVVQIAPDTDFAEEARKSIKN